MLKPLSILVVALVAGSVAAAAALAPRASARSGSSSLTEVNVATEDQRAAPVSDCSAPEFVQAASRNSASLQSLTWSPFGRAEKGWAIYQEHVAHDLDTSCQPGSPGFAAALARWQQDHRLPANGEATAQTLVVFKTRWQDARPYVALRASGVCPDAPPESMLTTLNAREGYKGKSIQLKNDVAGAYRRMVTVARAEVPELAADPEMLSIFSGYRSPAYDAARCARDHNCGGAERATCSVHRTATAFDLVVGSAPGFPVDSSADANRLFQSRTPAYRWLVANAGRFGFINYAFEPWHWEWVGEPARNGQIATIEVGAR